LQRDVRIFSCDIDRGLSRSVTLVSGETIAEPFGGLILRDEIRFLRDAKTVAFDDGHFSSAHQPSTPGKLTTALGFKRHCLAMASARGWQ